MGWREVSAQAAEQYGVVTLDDALLNVSHEQVRYAVREGRLEPVFTNSATYRFAGVPESWEQRQYAACRATGGPTSHNAAGRVWGVAHVPAVRLTLTVPADQVVRLEGVVAHRSNKLLPHHVTTYAGIPVTTGARTLVDLSAVLSDDTLELAGWFMLQFTPEMGRKVVVDKVRQAIDLRSDRIPCVEGG
jgi:hypothetical protein